MTAVQTPTVRLAFPTLIKPRVDTQGKEKFGACFIIDMDNLTQQDKARLGKLAEVCKNALREKFGDKAFLPDGNVNSDKYKWPFKRGEINADYEGFGAGTKFFNTSTTRRPGFAQAVRTQNGVEIRDTDDGSIFYPGCYVQAMCNPYTFDADGNRGVALGVQHIVFLRDGERIDGVASSASAAFSADSIDADALAFEEAGKEDQIDTNIDLV